MKIINTRFILLLVILITGFNSLIYEIYSIRLLFMFLAETIEAVSIAISSFLTGLALSAIIFSKLSKRNTNNIYIICLLQVLSALYGLIVLYNFEIIPQFLDYFNGFEISDILKAFLRYSIIWVYLFIPAFLTGGIFPLITGLYINELSKSSEQTGIVYFYSTIGSVLGSLVSGFYFIPVLGLKLTVLITIILSLACALFLCQKKVQYAVVIIFMAFVASKYSAIEYSAKIESRFGNIITQEQSPFGLITVGERNKRKTLYVNYRDMCTDSDTGSEGNLARTALNISGKNSNTLNIGLGCGSTANSLALHSNLKTLDIAEINPTIIKIAKQHFKKYTASLNASDNIQIIQHEGYDLLRNSNKKYDAVIVDVEEPTIIHSSALFTKDFFEEVYKKTSDRGVLALWSFQANDRFTKVIYNTLKQVFPYVLILKYNTSNNFYAFKKKPESQVILDPASEIYMQNIIRIDVNEINTIEHPKALKYFNTNQIFALPPNYKDQFEIENK